MPSEYEVPATMTGRRRATAWCIAMRAIAPVVGRDRAMRWAVWGVNRWVRFDVAGVPVPFEARVEHAGDTTVN